MACKTNQQEEEEKVDTPKQINSNKCFGGFVEKYECISNALGKTKTKFNVYVPPQASSTNRVPILYFLSGLTCNEDNFIQKSGAPRIASKYGIALICPDTSPRNYEPRIEGDADNWNFGIAAGFYLNATQSPWNKYYNMYDYIIIELPKLLKSVEKFSKIFDFNNCSIFGHSMGGHGALSIYLKNLKLFKSCSAIAPIANPTKSRWGQNAFNNYLGSVEDGKQYDSTELIQTLNDSDKKEMNTILIHQGLSDFALNQGDDNHDQLRVKPFEQACKENNVKIDVRYQEGYGHGYDFVATFIEDQISFHTQYLSK